MKSFVPATSQYFYLDLEKVIRSIKDIHNIEKHIPTVRSEAERVTNHNLPVCHPLAEVMGVHHYRPYYRILLLGSQPVDYRA